ncbi:hypothetical protein J4420_03355 [Candidatus Woesearchaeota archaeon]|nr:hypothetical protein [Candidatus Woesearchaeota archaeon]
MADQPDLEELYTRLHRAEGERVLFRTPVSEFYGVLQPGSMGRHYLLYRSNGRPSLVSLGLPSQLRYGVTIKQSDDDPLHCFSTTEPACTYPLYGLEGLMARITLWKHDIPKPDSVRSILPVSMPSDNDVANGYIRSTLSYDSVPSGALRLVELLYAISDLPKGENGAYQEISAEEWKKWVSEQEKVRPQEEVEEIYALVQGYCGYRFTASPDLEAKAGADDNLRSLVERVTEANKKGRSYRTMDMAIGLG